MKNKSLKISAALALAGMCLTSCTTVQPYQKMYLNDKEMVLSDKKIETFEINYTAYREGAAGANGGKVGGGCGCN